MKLDITDEIMDTNLEIKNGKVKRPDVVGVGVTITDDIKEKYKLVKNSNYTI
jgi:L-alanine-DL-glutamate epimerase-like enolase superfamily enzyme